MTFVKLPFISESHRDELARDVVVITVKPFSRAMDR